MASTFKGTVPRSEGIDSALRAALEEADNAKPPKVGPHGYEYEVKSITGVQHGFNGDTLTVEIQTSF
jgi:metal-responsive CopG/Arc/MetJ family transcriptional regulator